MENSGMSKYILALDQGTTSSRAILFDEQARGVGSAQQEFRQIYPSPGHVEHDPEEIWTSQLTVARNVLKKQKVNACSVSAIGITNQRETIVLWERETGKTIGNAIVWQSRVSNGVCERLKSEGLEQTNSKKNRTYFWIPTSRQPS